jgi:hypothetical protein
MKPFSFRKLISSYYILERKKLIFSVKTRSEVALLSFDFKTSQHLQVPYSTTIYK